MSFTLHLASVVAAGIISIILSLRLRAIADRMPADSDDSIERTNMYFLNRPSRDPAGRRLIRWFWLAQAALAAAGLAWLAGWPA